ncbi:MAG: hypothetical protein E6R03_09705 [Hyphomicrobiaceae bacterium]|nr:MAG: hypothetical protein E6R03_09705 [Hyphomicrobiaceae bacterium]
MAFGSGGGSGQDIELKVKLDTAQAEKQADALKRDIEGSFRKIADAAKNPVGSIKEIAAELGKTNPIARDLSSRFGGLSEAVTGLAGKATLAVGAIAALGFGLNKLVGIAADGDKFQDVADAFQENADKAGIFAGALEGRLSAALLDQVDKTTLLIAANKAFAAGIDPGVFDDLAAAAKRYADATGGDAVQSLDQLIQGIKTGRESMLKQFGTIKDGVLILNEFTSAQYELAKSNRNVTDTAELFTAQLKNVYQDFAQALNSSDALKLAVEALGAVFLKLAEVVSGAGKVILDVLNFLARRANEVISTISAGVVFASEVLRDLTAGEMPNLERATSEAAKQFGVFGQQAEKAGTVSIKLEKGLEGVGKGASKAKDAVKKAADELNKITNNTTDIIEHLLGGKTLLEHEIEKRVTEAFKNVGTDYGPLATALDNINRDILGRILDPEEAKKASEFLVKTISENLKTDQQTFTGIGDYIGQTLGAEIAPALSDGILAGLDAGVISGAITDLVNSAIDIGFRALSGEDVGDDAINTLQSTIVGKVGFGIAKGIGLLRGDSAGTKARKEADKFFADIFDGDRLALVVQGEIKRIGDLQFTGNEDPNSGAFAGLTAGVKGAFEAVGTAFEELLGITSDYSGRIAAVLFGNVGESLVNLQALIQQTGQSFEDLANALFETFFAGNIGIQQLQDGLVQLNNLFSVGIPGQIGAIDVAVQNLQISLAEDKGSRIIFNSLKAIGQEAIEAGKNLGQAAAAIAQGLGVGAEKVTLFLEAMKLAGIKSVQELVNASNAQLAALGANILQITQGGTPTNTTVAAPTTSITSTPNFASVGSSSAAKTTSAANTAAKRAEEERKRRLEQLRQETQKLVTASDEYKTIIDGLGNGTIRAVDAGNQLRKLFDNQFKVVQRLQKAQDAYNKALAEGVKGKKLADLAKELNAAQAASDKFESSINKASTPNLSGIIKLIKDMNTLGVVAKSVGIKVEPLVDTLVQGFLRGKLSIQEVNQQIAKTKDLLEQGIPGAVGAINDAFNNLKKGGTKGGVFSVDAFKDIFAEFDELFKKNGGEARKAELKRLTDNFDAARQALQQGIDTGKTPEEVAKLRDNFTGATNALEDFKNLELKPTLEDLRAELLKTFSADDVSIFFKAIEDEGITSIEDFAKASNETVVKVLGDLENLGFSFSQTVDANTQAIIEQFNEANNKLTDGKDLLQAQLDAIGSLLTGAEQLPSVLATGAAAFDGPLTAIAEQFSNVLNVLSKFDGQTYESDVILNLDVNPQNAKASALFELLFGNGSGSTTVPSGPGTGNGLTSAEKREFFALRRKRKAGKLSAADERRFQELNSKRAGG